MNTITLQWHEAGAIKSRTIDFSSLDSVASAIRLGRDSKQCDIVFSDPRISRLQAEITWNDRNKKFYLQNLRKSNPILINGHPLADLTPLDGLTTIVIGTTEIQVSLTLADEPIVQSTHEAADSEESFKSLELSNVGYSQIIPLSFLKEPSRRTSYLVPGILTVGAVTLLFANLGNPAVFNLLLALYLGGSGFCVIYQLCQKNKPWWVIGCTITMTPFLLMTPIWGMIILVFREILPGQIPNQETGLLSSFIAFFFGAGLAEELLKAIPIFVVAWWGQLLESSQRRRIGVSEPLDGIILGAASALSFTLIETLGQYVPTAIGGIASQSGVGVGQLVGLQLLIPRIVGSVFGHMAYTGCFGYYIGLSYLKPSKRWSCLTIGYFVASFIHAVWNVSSRLGSVAQGMAGLLSYCLLIGCILKARKVSRKYHTYLSS
ncbi:PrsW family glutamic-type intramembrane protease [Leptolyngbya sp. AN03gr2]|uniref:PrsW family glutamic-type intramembrane protease n=1 Tax=unclassified Leptolyngbya TaxID=2650499 RepID=UPI003D315A64